MSAPRGRRWPPDRPSQEDTSHRASPRAVVRELRESGDAPVHRVRIEYMWSRVRREAVEAAPTRVPTAAGPGVCGGIREE